MTQTAIGTRLPKDTIIELSGMLNKPPRLHIRMTLSTIEHVEALREAVTIFVQLMEISGAPPSQAAEAETGEDENSQPGHV